MEGKTNSKYSICENMRSHFSPHPSPRRLLDSCVRVRVMSTQTQIRRAEYWESVFAATKEALVRMAQGAVNKLPPAVLSAQEDALLALG